MASRREFLSGAAFVLANGAWGFDGQGLRADDKQSGRKTDGKEVNRSSRKRLAIVTTEWRFHSHAWHMGERFLTGYPIHGRWNHSPFEVVSAYVDQFPKSDVSRQRAKEFGFTIYPTIAEALRNGGDKLAVDAVLTIGLQTPTPGVPKTLPLETLESAFKAELDQSNGWWDTLEAQEKFWIQEGADVDGRFNDVYFSDRTHTVDDGKARYVAIRGYGKYIAGVLVLIGLVQTVSILRR